ncbi:prepilin-type N-terminal cleavage/methylation domain-containing protein [Corallococcus exiguus]|uniref:pilus assembly FimT family protein n=1 Tax=Corallococcus TaxID=83461 RepID=UPI000EBDD5D0|nr:MULTISPECIES: prepilin-type N-terminal cleavage/methylation domain-containing protein [Corallococcus]NPC68604.1 prepilin-type N-terminal cleavage/methylation domain-containing protein [Corallococcus exiguus]RKI04210.1 prepilin-type N-terminal cleavage/methylation domain-containing protein [Corallococcus sp. AB038B]
MKHARGMTLLEVLVAVAIVGVFTSMAVANYSSRLSGQRENVATRELWSSALRARQRAISTNQPVRFVVETNITQPNGNPATVARWERLACDDDATGGWSNDSCPSSACTGGSVTCRTNAACCSETGPDIVIPSSMNATAINGLCFLPGSARPVMDRTCMRDKLDDTAAQALATPTDKSIRFTFTSSRAASMLMVEPLTGLATVLDCDSVAATATSVNKDPRSVAACAP